MTRRVWVNRGPQVRAMLTPDRLVCPTDFTVLCVSQDEVDAELFQMEIGNAGAKGSLLELVTKWRTPLVITTTLAVFQQLTGHANVLNFAGEIFLMSGFRGAAPAVVLGVVKVVATILAIVLVRIL